ncbi:MAG TPA: SAM-dependent methyltransferase [Pseudolabrys sp.]|nr:SAM-dependent methyltransferase [Pseudolabrys sp.]
MTGFASDWLALREPYDMRSRNADVRDAVTVRFAGRESISVVDLACGRGSTLRAVTAHLPGRQQWRLIDHDAALLAEAAAMTVPPGIAIAATPLDLASNLSAAFDGKPDLVTASALLDLVSVNWIEHLAGLAAANGAAVYVALSYDGRVSIAPSDADDAAIIAAVNVHQHGDKGFGPALGPSAAAFALTMFKSKDFDVVDGLSDWVLGPDDRALQAAMFDGWASAARETGALPAARIEQWLTTRRRILEAGGSSLRVGHVDFFARPR